MPFNKPYCTGGEISNILKAVESNKLSGNGHFTTKSQDFLRNRYGFGKCLLTTSCTDALEMAAILLEIKEGDEVIFPSFTFVSTVNAFILRGAVPVFVDSRNDHPGILESGIESKITARTKAVVIVHYAGVSCDMNIVIDVCERFKIPLVEDAAQAIDSYFINDKGERKALGTFGTFATFSFHETKNIISGEGGMLVINDGQYMDRSEVIWEKGTNRQAFFRGEVDKYGWVDIGSSFLLSEINAAFLYGQLANIDKIQRKRLQIWDRYYANIVSCSDKIGLPFLPHYSANNAHMFYLICPSETMRADLIKWFEAHNIQAVFHYQGLHKSAFYRQMYKMKRELVLTNSERYSETLLRLPFFYELTLEEIDFICGVLTEFLIKKI